MHRSETKKQTNAIHMSTLVLKVFPNIKAVHQDKVDLLITKIPCGNPKNEKPHFHQHAQNIQDIFRKCA